MGLYVLFCAVALFATAIADHNHVWTYARMEFAASPGDTVTIRPLDVRNVINASIKWYKENVPIMEHNGTTDVFTFWGTAYYKSIVYNLYLEHGITISNLKMSNGGLYIANVTYNNGTTNTVAYYNLTMLNETTDVNFTVSNLCWDPKNVTATCHGIQFQCNLTICIAQTDKKNVSMHHHHHHSLWKSTEVFEPTLYPNTTLWCVYHDMVSSVRKKIVKSCPGEDSSNNNIGYTAKKTSAASSAASTTTKFIIVITVGSLLSIALAVSICAYVRIIKRNDETEDSIAIAYSRHDDEVETIT